MYYLQSRYYNPAVGRFLNADVVYDLDAGLEGYNLFLYCANDPVGRIDISGTDSEKVEDLDLADDEICQEGAGGLGYSSPVTGSQTVANGQSSGNGQPINSGYTAPPGGGGVSSTYEVGNQTVTFGHGGRHLDGTELSTTQVEPMIANDVVNANPIQGQHYNGNLSIGGIPFQYTAYRRSATLINVGTYFPLLQVHCLE